MFCLNCGEKVLDDASFCLNCGASTEAIRELEKKDLTESASLYALPNAPTYAPPTEPPFDPYCAPPSDPYFVPPTEPPFDPYYTPTSDPYYAPPAVLFPLPTQPEAPAAPEKKKRKKGILIAVGAALLVALIVTGSIVGYNIYRMNSYDKALEMLNTGDYQGAYDAFGKLGDYEDSASKQALARKWLDYQYALSLFAAGEYETALRAFEVLGSFEDSARYVTQCNQNLDYLAAVALYETGKFESALEIFTKLADEDFSDTKEWVKKTKYAIAGECFKDGKFKDALTIYTQLAALNYSDAKEWVNKTKYAIADETYKKGDLYEAYWGFKELGTYADARDRMVQCTTPFPATGTLYLNPAYAASYRSQFCIDASNATYSCYFKLYSGDNLVAVLWTNGGGKVTIDIVPGTYRLKEAIGEYWFGEEILFGDEGVYFNMIFEGGSDSFYLGNNIIITVTLAVQEGNVGAKKTDRSEF